MLLRKLKEKDAFLMLKWVQDDVINSCFEEDFSTLSLENCDQFIKQSWLNYGNLHIDTVNLDNKNMDTISSKNISERKG